MEGWTFVYLQKTGATWNDGGEVRSSVRDVTPAAAHEIVEDLRTVLRLIQSAAFLHEFDHRLILSAVIRQESEGGDFPAQNSEGPGTSRWELKLKLNKIQTRERAAILCTCLTIRIFQTHHMKPGWNSVFWIWLFWQNKIYECVADACFTNAVRKRMGQLVITRTPDVRMWWNRRELGNGRPVVSRQTTKDSTAGQKTQFARDLRGVAGEGLSRRPAQTLERTGSFCTGNRSEKTLEENTVMNTRSRRNNVDDHNARVNTNQSDEVHTGLLGKDSTRVCTTKHLAGNQFQRDNHCD